MRGNDRLVRIVKMSSDGHITIPAEFREALGLGDATHLCVSMTEGEIRLRPMRVSGIDEASDWLDVLYQAYAPIRADILARGYSATEIDADIDAAIAEVRSERLASRT